MPNHITNKLFIDLPEDADIWAAVRGEYPVPFTDKAKAVREFLRSDRSQIDFNNIKKMPEILQDIVSGTTRIHGFSVENPIRKYFPKDTKFIPSGFGDELMTEDGVWVKSHDLFIPEGTVAVERRMTKEEERMLDDEVGARDWYSWACKNWGTKWNAYEVDAADACITFDTAWSGVPDLITELSLKFPDVTFGYAYADEDTGNNTGIGTIKNGEQNIFFYSGCTEAYKVAFAIRPEAEDYYDFVDGEYVYKEEEDDALPSDNAALYLPESTEES